MNIRRHLSAPNDSFFLFGARGTGKSLWTKAAFPDAVRVDLLRPDAEREYAAKPERLFDLVAGHPEAGVFVIDEVQKAPGLLDVVHALIEKNRERPRFVLTGSSVRKLRRGGVDLMAGRAVVRAMHPFMASELGEEFNLGRALETGTIPLIHAGSSPVESLASYVTTYVKEEVMQEGLVRRADVFYRVLETLSFSHGGLLNATNIARECGGVTTKTVLAHVEILEDLQLAFRLPPFTRRAQRGVSQQEKFYFFDPGVFRAVRPKGPLDRPEEMAGAALEGLVAQQLLAWKSYGGGPATLHHWRTHGGHEVDFALYGEGVFAAVEVKNTDRLRGSDLNGLKHFLKDYPEASPLLLYRGRERLAVDGIPCVPVENWLRSLVPGVTPAEMRPKVN